MNVLSMLIYFQAQDASQMWKLGVDLGVKTIWRQPELFKNIGICVISLAQESEMRIPFGAWSREEKKKAISLIF